MISSIHCINIQGHVNSILELPERGVVRIHGPNSAGKSALLKPLLDMLSGRISITKERCDLINDFAPEARYIVETHDGRTLAALLHEEPSKTEFTYIDEEGKEITRNLNDKMLGNLLGSLKFHYDAKTDQSLHISIKDNKKLIIDTSPEFNGELVRSSWKDLNAETAKINCIGLLEEANDQLKLVNTSLGSAMYRLQGMQDDIDIEGEELAIKKLKSFAGVLNLMQLPVTVRTDLALEVDEFFLTLYVPSIREVEIPLQEDLSLIEVIVPEVKKVELPTIMDYSEELLKLLIPEERVTTLPEDIDVSLLSILVPKVIDLTPALKRLYQLEKSLEEERCPVCNVLIDEDTNCGTDFLEVIQKEVVVSE